MEATRYSETSDDFQRTIWSYIPANITLCEKLVSTRTINVKLLGFAVKTREADWSLEAIPM
jgi:hypothetical protein